MSHEFSHKFKKICLMNVGLADGQDDVPSDFPKVQGFVEDVLISINVG